jgi:hypothetical protein
MQEKKQMHKNKAGARRFFLQTPAFYGQLETGLWGFIDSFNVLEFNVLTCFILTPPVFT